MDLSNLPRDVIREITSWFTPAEIVSMRMTNKYWREIIHLQCGNYWNSDGYGPNDEREYWKLIQERIHSIQADIGKRIPHKFVSVEMERDESTGEFVLPDMAPEMVNEVGPNFCEIRDHLYFACIAKVIGDVDRNVGYWLFTWKIDGSDFKGGWMINIWKDGIRESSSSDLCALRIPIERLSGTRISIALSFQQFGKPLERSGSNIKVINEYVVADKPCRQGPLSWAVNNLMIISDGRGAKLRVESLRTNYAKIYRLGREHAERCKKINQGELIKCKCSFCAAESCPKFPPDNRQ